MTLEAISKYLATASRTVDGYMKNCFPVRVRDAGFHGGRATSYALEADRRIRDELPEYSPPQRSKENEIAAKVNLTELVADELSRLDAYIGTVAATAARMAAQLGSQDAARQAGNMISGAVSQMNGAVAAARQSLN